MKYFILIMGITIGVGLAEYGLYSADFWHAIGASGATMAVLFAIWLFGSLPG